MPRYTWSKFHRTLCFRFPDASTSHPLPRPRTYFATRWLVNELRFSVTLIWFIFKWNGNTLSESENISRIPLNAMTMTLTTISSLNSPARKWLTCIACPPLVLYICSYVNCFVLCSVLLCFHVRCTYVAGKKKTFVLKSIKFCKITYSSIKVKRFCIRFTLFEHYFALNYHKLVYMRV